MDDGTSLSSDSDTDDFDTCIWSMKNRKSFQNKNFEEGKPHNEIIDQNTAKKSVEDKYQKFEELRKKSNDMKRISAKKLYNSEKKRAKKLVKRALRDPFIKEVVEQNKSLPDNVDESRVKAEAEEWKEVKPFLNVNNHIQGPVSHGNWGPKTELESTIDNAIKEGDFEKAELLSDTLANREFAAKITKAYAAKRCYEKTEIEKSVAKDKDAKKIRWTFEAKERWQMKGNM